MCRRKSADKIKACMWCVRETVCRAGDSAPADHVPCPNVDGTSSQRKRLQELLTKHAAGFIKDKQDLGYTEAVHHRLRTAGSISVAQPYRRIPPHQLQEVQEHIKGLLAPKVIVDSHSPYAAPVVIVREKDGGICLCVDYRRLNAEAIGDAYPLPRIQVFWCTGRGPVLFDSGPGQRLPSNCRASRWPTQDGLRDADGTVRVHQNADGSVIGASDLPTPHAVHDVRLHLPVPAGVSGRSAGVLEDVWRAPCPPGPSSAAHHRRWSEVPISTTPGPLLGAHHLRWGRQLRDREGGSREELAGAGDHYCSAQLFGLRQLLPTLYPGVLEDCWSPPWPGRQGQPTSQEEMGRHLQAMGPAAPEGVRRAEDSPDYSSCPGVCRVHQALHPRDRRQPWRAERHPLSRSRWAEKGLGLRKSTAASHREEPGQLLQHEAGIPGP